MVYVFDGGRELRYDDLEKLVVMQFVALWKSPEMEAWVVMKNVIRGRGSSATDFGYAKEVFRYQ